jgi:hypothetical protein
MRNYYTKTETAASKLNFNLCILNRKKMYNVNEAIC